MSIKERRLGVAERVEQLGAEFLEELRAKGLPEPDGKEFGHKMLKYCVGLEALQVAVNTPGFRVVDTHPRLREWLADPVTGVPASDKDLMVLIWRFCLPKWKEVASELQ